MENAAAWSKQTLKSESAEDGAGSRSTTSCTISRTCCPLKGQASVLPDTLPSGALAAPSVAAVQLPGGVAYFDLAAASGAPAPVYWTVLQRGCAMQQLAVAAVQALHE